MLCNHRAVPVATKETTEPTLPESHRAPLHDAPTTAWTHSSQDVADEADALRWREMILRVSAALEHASKEEGSLAQLLAHALEHALRQLLLHGDDRELIALEAWLEEEPEIAPMAGEAGAVDERVQLNDLQDYAQDQSVRDSTFWCLLAGTGKDLFIRDPFTGFFSWPSIIGIGQRA